VFIGIVVVFWLLTLLPSYSTLIAPGIMNVVNTINRFLSGFLVPFSGIVVSLIAIGGVSNIDPNLKLGLDTIRLFDPEGFLGLSTGGQLVAGLGAVSATGVTLTKAVAKPGISAATGTIGTTSAPVYTTLENLASVVLVGLGYVLSTVNPWLLVALGTIVILLVVGIMVLALYQLWRLKRGVGKVFYWLQVHPRAGLSVITEVLFWGSGWLIWKIWARGAVMLCLWAAAAALGGLVLLPLVTAFSGGLLLIPFVLLSAMLYLLVGLATSRSLMHILEERIIPDQPGAGLSASPMPSM
jgi:hypothetical protein